MKTIGIIGGMGPLATVDLFKKIILHTRAQSDQEHSHIVIDNNTDVPDRTACIEGHGASPVDEILKSAKRLESIGADFLVMGCNTAHYFMPEILPKLSVPFMSLIEVTAKKCKEKGLKSVCLLATFGTYESGIYKKELEKYGIECLEPDDDGKQVIEDIIYYGVKACDASYDTKKFVALLKSMHEKGADEFILGCTELPVAVEMYHINDKFIDATDVLAVEAVKFAGGTVQ